MTITTAPPTKSTADRFFEDKEGRISHIQEWFERVAKLETKRQAAAGNRTFVWRGQADASWSLHSSLYRHLKDATGSNPTDEKMRSFEQRLVRQFGIMGLQNSEQGMLRGLDQFAIMQHHGIPTRLIDVTYNAMTALWFACENEKHDGVDGRLFALDVTGLDRSVWDSTVPSFPADEVPWLAGGGDSFMKSNDWGGTFFAWRPARLDARIIAQEGGFLIGGVPETTNADGSPNQWKKSNGGGYWGHSEVLESISISTRIHKVDPVRGGVSITGNPVYSFRIDKGMKSAVRTLLQSMFGYGYARIYPDMQGLRSIVERW